jgi:hypothetical protein
VSQYLFLALQTLRQCLIIDFFSRGYIKVIQEIPEPKRIEKEYINEKKCSQWQEKYEEIHK